MSVQGPAGGCRRGPRPLATGGLWAHRAPGQPCAPWAGRPPCRWRPETCGRGPGCRCRPITPLPPPAAPRSVLDEVRALWEAKLVATGVVGEPSNEGQQ